MILQRQDQQEAAHGLPSINKAGKTQAVQEKRKLNRKAQMTFV